MGNVFWKMLDVGASFCGPPTNLRLVRYMSADEILIVDSLHAIAAVQRMALLRKGCKQTFGFVNRMRCIEMIC